MNITKECISNNIKISRALGLVIKINYISLNNGGIFDSLNFDIAAKLLKYCENSLCDKISELTGNVIAINHAEIMLADEDIVSVKYDFCITSLSSVIFHRRYCISYLPKYDKLLLPMFIKGGKKRDFLSYYLSRRENILYQVPLLRKSVPSTTVLKRKAELDKYLDGRAKKVKISLPACMKKLKTAQTVHLVN